MGKLLRRTEFLSSLLYFSCKQHAGLTWGLPPWSCNIYLRETLVPWFFYDLSSTYLRFLPITIITFLLTDGQWLFSVTVILSVRNLFSDFYTGFDKKCKKKKNLKYVKYGKLQGMYLGHCTPYVSEGIYPKSFLTSFWIYLKVIR